MAIKLIGQDYCEAQGGLINNYIVDTVDDIAKLPKSCTGSVAVVAEKDGGVYMVNASGEWREQ